MSASPIEVIQFLALPFVMCLILAGIHCYLGIHVLERGVIFVDLSLAQVAAFGSTLALLLGFEHESPWIYFISLGSTFLAAGLFSAARKFENKIGQEAIIGIVYAFGSAAVVLATDKMAHGSEHIKDLLVGQVLWVSGHDVIKVSLIYGVVAALHYIFRGKFFAATRGTLQENAGFWDFAFYALFGVVITSSVSVAGVLQVFAYLIVPSVVANMYFQSVKARLLFGWAFGFVVSLTGMTLSYIWDVPSGACIVVAFTLVPIGMVVLNSLGFLPQSRVLATRSDPNLRNSIEVQS
jgi:zinc/manganese transport system permease protein